MDEIQDIILAALTSDYVSARAITNTDPDFAHVPPDWLPILDTDDPHERCQIALSLWPEQFLQLLPQFAEMFPSKLQDVHIFWLRGGVDPPEGRFVLIYAAGRDPDEDEPILWIGWDPSTFGDTMPTYFDTIPEPAQRFLRQTHAGFTANDHQSYGLAPPRRMKTLAESAGPPMNETGWDVGYRDIQINSTRLLWLTRDSGELLYCTSPDFPPGTVALIYEGDIDDPLEEFWPALDNLLVERWDEDDARRFGSRAA